MFQRKEGMDAILMPDHEYSYRCPDSGPGLRILRQKGDGTNVMIVRHAPEIPWRHREVCGKYRRWSQGLSCALSSFIFYRPLSWLRYVWDAGWIGIRCALPYGYYSSYGGMS